MIEIKNITYSFDENTKLYFPNWTVGSENGLILGSSGCGKTTLLHLMGGLLQPLSGEVKVNSQIISHLTTSRLDQFRGANIGFVFQRPHLISSLSVKDNIRLAAFLGNKSKSEAKIQEVLDELGIGGLGDRKIFEVSQGQAQRVSIARAVINEPTLILGDEPTASLDDESCQSVIRLLKNQAERYGATLVIATHDQRIKSEFKNQLTL